MASLLGQDYVDRQILGLKGEPITIVLISGHSSKHSTSYLYTDASMNPKEEAYIWSIKLVPHWTATNQGAENKMLQNVQH